MKSILNNSDDTCELCEGEMYYYLTGSDLLYGTTLKVFNLFKCRSCGLEKIIPLPAASQIKYFYPVSYYSYNTLKKTEQEKSLFFRIREKIVERHFSKKTKKDLIYFLSLASNFLLAGIPLKHFEKNRFLDIGCGDGYNLKLLKRFGWDVTGFEIGSKAKKGSIYYDKSFNIVDFGGKKFDFIRVWHVLEHVSDPKKFVKRVAMLLNKDGEIVIGLPNTNSLYSKIFKKYWYGRDIPRHLYGYNLKNLKMLLESEGVITKEIKYTGVGGLNGSIQHLIKNEFEIKLDLVNNIFLVLLLLPLDVVLNFLSFGDAIAFTGTFLRKSLIK